MAELAWLELPLVFASLCALLFLSFRTWVNYRLERERQRIEEHAQTHWQILQRDPAVQQMLLANAEASRTRAATELEQQKAYTHQIAAIREQQQASFAEQYKHLLPGGWRVT